MNRSKSMDSSDALLEHIDPEGQEQQDGNIRTKRGL